MYTFGMVPPTGPLSVYGVVEGLQRMRGAVAFQQRHLGRVRRHRMHLRAARVWRTPSLVSFDCAMRCATISRASRGERRLSVFEHDGIKKDKLSDALRRAIRRAGDRQSAKTVADQNDVGQVFVLEDIDDVLDEDAEINSLRKQMRTFTKATERRG